MAKAGAERATIKKNHSWRKRQGWRLKYINYKLAHSNYISQLGDDDRLISVLWQTLQISTSRKGKVSKSFSQ